VNYIAVDIGATKVRVAVCNKKSIIKRIVETTDQQNGPMGISNQISRMINHVSDNPKAIGIGSIGPIDLKKGMILSPPNYPFNQIPIVEPLREKFGVQTMMGNDCTVAVQGERLFGAGKGLDNLFYVTFSTGLGGGAIVDGHVLSGKDGNAVEIGHIIIDANSELVCGCGGKGHWEAYSGGKNIPKFAQLLLNKIDWKRSLLYNRSKGKLTNINIKMIFSCAKNGDHICLEIIEEIGKVNTIGFANIVNIFDPELITIGGAVALNNPFFILDPILEGIDQHIINRKPEIMITPLGEDAVLLGALAMIL
jgi:glucokinase